MTESALSAWQTALEAETPRDWHKADVIAALHKANITLAQVARGLGVKPSNTSKVFATPYPRMERGIAKALGVTAKDIWPSRYTADGRPNRHRGRPKTKARSALGRRISHVCDVVNGKKGLSKLAGVSETHIYRLINGSSSPTFDLLMRIADARGISRKWLFLGEGEMFEDQGAA